MDKESMQSKGGKARSKSLTSEQRSQIASEAAAARWKIPQATHAGPLEIGNAVIDCYVLRESGGAVRILSTRGVMKALGRSWRGRKYAGTKLPVFLEAKNLKEFIDADLESVLTPIRFRTSNGVLSEGFKAEMFPRVCEVFLKARDANALLPSQSKIAIQADILLRGLATVGIIAMVDAATGYEDVRDRLALQQILAQFIGEELLKWAKRFPDDFYREMFRLKGWRWQGMRVNRPQVVGKYTNDIVYDRLAAGVTDELRSLNPPDDKGQRKHRHHQWLTEDVGHPKLRDHLNGVIALMKVSTSWKEFKRMLNKVFPKKGSNMELDV